ncbi:MAG: peptidoglycan DD-metalloendopeptidase family protein [Bacteroidetes bacterium]|nr:peptidoglycan DD-metalloendopeptidase family protein [Bacteroidota bacterium]
MNGSKFVNIITLTLSILISSGAFAQKNKAQLEKEKKEHAIRILEAEKILKSTEKKKRATVGQLNAINQQIKSREALIGTIREEINWYNRKILDDEQIIEALNADLESLRQEYAVMVYAGYKASQNQDKLTFLFSSDSFNKFLMRLKYYEQYGKSRRYQASQIVKVEDILRIEISGFEHTKTEKEALLAEEIIERNKLGELKKKQKVLVTSLTIKEKELKKELASRKKAVTELNALIDKMIREEIAAKTAAETTASMAISDSFAGNRQRLPWPVNEGFISSGFGKHNHPVYKKLIIDNKGVYIQTKPEEKITAVFDGKVSAIVTIPGMNKAVIIQHGEYRTVYANLKSVSVEMNQLVRINDQIGKVYTKNDGDSELFFQIWKNTSILNPLQWLSKR